MTEIPILVSACLLQIPCQYDGQMARIQLCQTEIEALNRTMIPVCPEQLAGLATPRKPVEIVGGDGQDVLVRRAHVVSADGENFTEQFIKGAYLVLEIGRVTGATKMITQHRSPSCASTCIYNGTFSHTLKPGQGVCAALLQTQGIELIDVNAFKGKA